MKVDLRTKDILKLLNGFICVYKPRDMSVLALKKHLLNNICEQGNELEVITVPLIKMPVVKPHPKSGAPVVVGMRKQLDYTQHPLMGGRLFHPHDILIEELHYAEPMFAIGSGVEEIPRIKEQAWISEYIIDAELGKEKKNDGINERISNEALYEHVTQHKMHKLLANVQARFKRASFELANVDPQSQEAFEIARKGAPRPKVLNSPIVYSIELLAFKLPYFSLRLNAASENDPFLRGFVRELAVGLGTTACPRRLRRSRLGPFTTEHALLDKQLHLPLLLNNIQMCREVMERNCSDEMIVKPMNKEELDTKTLVDHYEMNQLEEYEDMEPDCLRLPWGREYTKVESNKRIGKRDFSSIEGRK